ncbi:MAG: hypothetical protein IPM54_39845 [Polyangiaceae bacterium]|nr:hypothetical protein [Polyangiaceae bacterium]MBK9265931.1 hypothetical protein [Polyangiaceae bacterium]
MVPEFGGDTTNANEIGKDLFAANFRSAFDEVARRQVERIQVGIFGRRRRDDGEQRGPGVGW